MTGYRDYEDYIQEEMYGNVWARPPWNHWDDMNDYILREAKEDEEEPKEIIVRQRQSKKDKGG